jgi:hypothetical protein
MAKNYDPNPPSRRDESFPKTTTIPEGWVSDAIMESYNHTGPSSNGHGEHGKGIERPTVTVDENLFSRRLEPFPKPNTIPNGWDPAGL